MTRHQRMVIAATERLAAMRAVYAAEQRERRAADTWKDVADGAAPEDVRRAWDEARALVRRFDERGPVA